MIALTKEDRRKLELAGLIKPPIAIPLTMPKRPLYVIAPVKPNSLRTHLARQQANLKPGYRPASPYPRSVAECRATCMCIHCRVEPAIFYGEGLGYGAMCPECTAGHRTGKRRVKR